MLAEGRRRADRDQIELVDMSPEALRRRMAHGNIYHPDKVDAALANYFRIGNLHALRELALLWLADRVDEGVKRHRTTCAPRWPPPRPRCPASPTPR
jgi:two-component system sensor histidine kinase KdpD